MDLNTPRVAPMRRPEIDCASAPPGLRPRSHDSTRCRTAGDGAHMPLASLLATNTGHLLRRIFVRLRHPPGSDGTSQRKGRSSLSELHFTEGSTKRKKASTASYKELKIPSCPQGFPLFSRQNSTQCASE